MFASPDPNDVEAQRTAQASAPPQYVYANQFDPNTPATKTTTTTMQTTTMMQPQGGPVSRTTSSAQQPGQMMQGGAQGQAGQPPQKSTISRISASVDWGTHVFLIAFMSMLVMIVTSQLCSNLPFGQCVALYAYEVAVGTVSLIIALGAAVLYWLGYLEHVGWKTAISIFLFLWWIPGVIVLTFIGNFTTTQSANGYFATWGAFIFSLFALVAISPTFEGNVNKTIHSIRKPLFFLAISSLVVMGAAIGPCSADCSGYNAYAIVVSVISAFFAIVLFFLPENVEWQLLKAFSVFFVLWWIFGVACLTLGNPFRSPGNGYFGSFFALFSSLSLLRALHQDV